MGIYAKKMRKLRRTRIKKMDDVSISTAKNLSRSLVEIWDYLKRHKEDEIPMSYQMLSDLFDGLDRNAISRIFKNALRSSI